MRYSFLISLFLLGYKFHGIPMVDQPLQAHGAWSKRQEIWGEGTTSCASDSKKFGAWDQNLMTEWHIRYHGRGVMIYWHVEKFDLYLFSVKGLFVI